jgi:hypothetical protein
MIFGKDREGLLESASPPDRLSSSGRITILGSSSRKCPEAIVVPVDKIAWRCKRVTERAGQRPVLVTPRLTRDEAQQIAADAIGA